MDEIQDHLAVRERCKALLAERGWRQVAIVGEGPGEIGLVFLREPSVTGLTREMLIVQIADRVSEKLLRARTEIKSDLQAFGVITIVADPAPSPFSQDLSRAEFMGEDGRARLLDVLEELESWAAARGGALRRG